MKDPTRRREDRAQRKGAGRPRLADVAAAAGVSMMTVSRVLRTPLRVAETTRTLVLKTIDELGYIPNTVAGSLASTQSRTIAAIVPTVEYSIFTGVIQGLLDVLRNEGYELVIGDTGFSRANEEKSVLAALGRQVDGVILTGGMHTALTNRVLADAELPVVETWSLLETPIDMCVGFSNFEAARTMTDYLIAQGRTRIGFVVAKTKHNDRALARVAGYRAAYRAAGYADDPSLIEESVFGFRQGARTLNTLVERHPDLDAVFFADDTMAAGAVMECARRGWAVPDRIAIAGFDDLEIAREINPALTTIRIDEHQIGVLAAEMILDRLNGRDERPSVQDIGFELVVRQST